jgi:hypothetical protein
MTRPKSAASASHDIFQFSRGAKCKMLSKYCQSGCSSLAELFLSQLKLLGFGPVQAVSGTRVSQSTVLPWD